MAETLGLPPSTCHRLLDILRREGFIDIVESRKKYVLGTDLVRICAEVSSQQDVAGAAMPFLRKISEESGESAVFSLYLPAQKKMCYAARFDSPAALRFDIRLHVPSSLLWGASGLSIAAFLPRQDVDTAYAVEGPSPATGAKLPTRRELERRLTEIRTLGYVVTFGEKLPGSTGIGVPVFTRKGSVVGSLLVVYPSARLSDERRHSLVGLLLDMAGNLSTLAVERTAEPV